MYNCKHCNLELNDDNWLPSRKIRNYKVCKICIRKDNNKRYSIKKDNYLARMYIQRKDVKYKVLEYYGGECNFCKIKDFNVLSLDHIDGNGRAHRKSILGTDSGSNFYKWVLKNKPDNLRLLCYNCNCQHNMQIVELIEKYDFNCKYCGSEEKVKLDVCINCRNIKKQNKQIISKNKVYGFYGGKCIYCNCADSRFLTIDHILNNGSSHRKEIGQNIYFWLISNNMPKDNFQLLCYNCNYSKYFRSLNINTIIT